MREPLVSIIMSTYNEKIYELEQSIYSICSQSYKNLEIIIINDNPNSMKNKDCLIIELQLFITIKMLAL